MVLRWSSSKHQTFNCLKSTFGKLAPFHTTSVFNWFIEYKRWRLSQINIHKHRLAINCNHQKTVSCEQTDKDCQVTYMETNPRLKIRLVAVYKINHDHLHLKKRCSRWMPYLWRNIKKLQSWIFFVSSYINVWTVTRIDGVSTWSRKKTAINNF